MAGLRIMFLATCLLGSLSVAAQPRTQFMPGPDVGLAPKPDVMSIQSLETRPERNFVTLGRFSATGADRDELLAAAKQKAAELGADFVLIVKTAETSQFRAERPSARLEAGRKSIAPRATMTAPTPAIRAIFGVYTKAAIGLVYEDPQTTLGRLIVRDFRPSSNAAGAGVRLGDEVVEINGLRPGDSNGPAMVLALNPDDIVKLLLKRGDATLTVEVALTSNN